MGLVGFSHTLAMEGAKYNILSNVIVPIAYSRMSATVMAPGKFVRDSLYNFIQKAKNYWIVLKYFYNYTEVLIHVGQKWGKF